MSWDPQLVYDTDSNVVESPDMEKGQIKTEQRVAVHHDATPAVEEVFHWETLEGTEDIEPGGLQQKVIDTPYQPERAAWDEYVNVQIYHPYTEEELAEKNKPTEMDRLSAQVFYTAMMTDTVIPVT